jgi:hypothetical protein
VSHRHKIHESGENQACVLLSRRCFAEVGFEPIGGIFNGEGQNPRRYPNCSRTGDAVGPNSSILDHDLQAGRKQPPIGSALCHSAGRKFISKLEERSWESQKAKAPVSIGAGSHPKCPEHQFNRPPVGRRRKVRFAPLPSVQLFQVELPASVVGRDFRGLRAKPTVHLPVVKSILKLKACSDLVPQLSIRGKGPCPDERADWRGSFGQVEVRSHNVLDKDCELHRDQDRDLEQGWQVVRYKRRWRKERQALPKKLSLCNASQTGRVFKQRMHGRCFNCLSLDHRVDQCRDPRRCWFCKRSGHISSSCKSKSSPASMEVAIPPKRYSLPASSPSLHNSRTKPIQLESCPESFPLRGRELSSSLQASLPQSRSSMDRRQSFGWGSEEWQKVQRRRETPGREMRDEVRGCAVNYPGNPRFRPKFAFNLADISEEMNQRQQLLATHAVVISDL